MHRLSLLVLGALACNPPEGKDNTTLLIDLQPLEDGSAISLMEMVVFVDETARTYDNEVEVTLGGLFNADATFDINLSILEGLSEVATGYRRSSEDAASAVWQPNMSACDGLGYEIRSDESCEYRAAAIVGADRVHTLLMGFNIKSQAPKGEEGVEVEVSIAASVAQAEPAE